MKARPTASYRRVPLLAILVVITGVYACSIYANLSFAATTYRFFPPFEPATNQNENSHLGAEYFNIARSLVDGEGFANPFFDKTGATAWMPPVLSLILAGLLRVCGSKDAVMAVVVFLQVNVLIFTGLLVLVLARRTTLRLGMATATAFFLIAVVGQFRLCFQCTHDYWLILLAVDLLIAGFCWLDTPARRASEGALANASGWCAAAAWGLFGGLCALINPVLAPIWGTWSLVVGWRHRAWSRLALAMVIAGFTLIPWTIRNYLVFGRLIPVKSNLAYELYQSQCLQADGLIQNTTFGSHPYASDGPERQEYKQKGEIAFLDHKKQVFWQAVTADPQSFLERVADRFLAATLAYVPYDRQAEARRPRLLWFGRLTHPLPFLGMLVLLFTARRQPLHWTQWTVIAVYLLYLLPYIVISYYDRYTVPLLGVKVLLVIWGADRLLFLLSRARTPGRASVKPVLPAAAVRQRGVVVAG